MNRLRAYRAIEGDNQAELGEKLGMSPQMVSAVESGRRTFTGDLAKLGYAPTRFDTPTMSDPLHRHRASTTAAAKNRAQELLRLAGEVFKELRDKTDRAPYLALEKLPAPTTTDEWEDAAIDVRALLQHEERGPIRNLTSATERAGICIVPMPGLPGIDGLSAWVDDVAVIGLTPNVPGDRFRFSLAHEIGHLTFHRMKSDTTESEANRFAGALLFPHREFDAAMPDYPQLSHFIELKKSWGMAVSAINYRAHDLGHVDDKRYRALQIQMSKWHRVEPAGFDPAYGELLAKLIDVHGGISAVADDLGVNRDHLAALTNWSHLRLA